MSVIPDSKVHGDNMGPTWVQSAPDGPRVGPMNRAIRDGCYNPIAELYLATLLKYVWRIDALNKLP